jgi:hypothetical protein
MKLLWMQNEGWALRPRLDALAELKRGDTVWVYGMNAQEFLMDDEPKPDIRMIPTGVRGLVRGVEDERFWVKFEEDIPMGMCGGPIIRDGKCVGMLTALVHSEAENKTLAGCGMCTHARDIRHFLLETEKQMKNLAPNMWEKSYGDSKGTRPENKDWKAVVSKLARHVEIPISNTRIDNNFVQGDDSDSASLYARSGMMNREFQENFMGLDSSNSTDNKAPEGFENNCTVDGEKKHELGLRPDKSPLNYHTAPGDTFKAKNGWESSPLDDTREAMKDVTRDFAGKDPDTINNLRVVLESHRARRKHESDMASATTPPQGTYFKNQDTSRVPFDDAEGKRRREAAVKAPRTGYDSGTSVMSDESLMEGIWGKH